jgi:virulence factor Mce-like protein
VKNLRATTTVPGVVALVVLLAFSYFAFHRSVPGRHTKTLHALFSSSQGVITGAPVRVAGVDVGRVVSVDRGPRDTADVGFTLHDDAPPVYTDARLRLRPRLFLEGGFYVQLSPGTGSAARRLRDGGVIPLVQTSVAVQSDQILSALAAHERARGTTIIHELARTFSGDGPRQIRALTRALPPALRHGAIAAQAARGTSGHDVSDIVRSSSAIAATLDKHRRALVGTTVDGARTSAALAASAPALRAVFAEAQRLLHDAPPGLDAVDRTLPAVGRLLVAVRPAAPVLPGVLSHASALLDQLRLSTRDASLPRLIRTAAPTVRRLPGLVRRATPLLDRTGHVSACVATRIVPVLASKVDDGRLSSGRPVWQDLVHASTNLAGTAQNFDANGPWSRFQGGGSSYVFSTGDVPNVGMLVGQTSLPLLGTRPQWQGMVPPIFRPDADCASQPAPSLAAPVGTVERSVPLRKRKGGR